MTVSTETRERMKEAVASKWNITVAVGSVVIPIILSSIGAIIYFNVQFAVFNAKLDEHGRIHVDIKGTLEKHDRDISDLKGDIKEIKGGISTLRDDSRFIRERLK